MSFYLGFLGSIVITIVIIGVVHNYLRKNAITNSSGSAVIATSLINTIANIVALLLSVPILFWVSGQSSVIPGSTNTNVVFGILEVLLLLFVTLSTLFVAYCLIAFVFELIYNRRHQSIKKK